MSIRAHVRKLRPVNDISIPLVEKVQDFLTEGSLSPAEIVITIPIPVSVIPPAIAVDVSPGTTTSTNCQVSALL